MRVMLEKTDDDHALTMSQIMDELEKYDVTAERKCIYADFADMTEKFGIEIIKEQIGRETYYHVGSREFELTEVKFLVDAIQFSKFITQTETGIGKRTIITIENEAGANPSVGTVKRLLKYFEITFEELYPYDNEG